VNLPRSELHAKFCADYSNEDQPAIQIHKSVTLSTYEILMDLSCQSNHGHRSDGRFYEQMWIFRHNTTNFLELLGVLRENQKQVQNVMGSRETSKHRQKLNDSSFNCPYWKTFTCPLYYTLYFLYNTFKTYASLIILNNVAMWSNFQYDILFDGNNSGTSSYKIYTIQIIVSQTMGKHNASLLKVSAHMLISTQYENMAQAWLSCQESGWTVC